jgi:hypothetical protein
LEAVGERVWEIVVIENPWMGHKWMGWMERTDIFGAEIPGQAQ